MMPKRLANDRQENNFRLLRNRKNHPNNEHDNIVEYYGLTRSLHLLKTYLSQSPDKFEFREIKAEPQNNIAIASLLMLQK